MGTSNPKHSNYLYFKASKINRHTSGICSIKGKMYCKIINSVNINRRGDPRLKATQLYSLNLVRTKLISNASTLYVQKSIHLKKNCTMSECRWTRPASVSYPTVWQEFNRKDKHGNVLHFTIQDLTEDLYEPCIEHMKQYFLADEPLIVALGLNADKTSCEEQVEYWKEILPEKLSLVCLLKNTNKEIDASSQIIGVKFQYYHHKLDDDAKEEFKGETFNQLINVMDYLADQADRYRVLKIEDYIDDYGLSVHPNYRRMGIATELLKATCKVAKAVGINTLITVFSAIGSQKAAEKTGYKNLIEINYTELAKIFPTYKLNVQGAPSIRYMYITVD